MNFPAAISNAVSSTVSNTIVPSLRRHGLSLIVLVGIFLSGCSAMTAQNPSGTFSPVNAVNDDPESRLLLKGADVTAYFTAGKYLQGSSQFRSQYQGVDFRFASAEAKALFDQAPTKYLPEFGGYCANGLVYGIPWGGDADTWKIIGGKLYIFGGQASKDGFELDEAKNLQLAHQYWKDEAQGTHSFYQRAKRLVFKVPHYLSGEELARQVAQRKTQK
jgi:YHS domain-containing protein